MLRNAKVRNPLVIDKLAKNDLKQWENFMAKFLELHGCTQQTLIITENQFLGLPESCLRTRSGVAASELTLQMQWFWKPKKLIKWVSQLWILVH
jgi:hypothetical protein